MSVEHKDNESLATEPTTAEQAPAVEEVVIDDPQNADSDSSQESELEVVIGEEKEATEPRKMTPYELRKKFKEEQDKKRRANARADEFKNENIELKARLERMEKSMSGMLSTQRPDPMNYSSKEEFYAALDEWTRNNSFTPEASQKSETVDEAMRRNTYETPPPDVNLTDDEAFHLYQAESQFTEKLPDYENIKGEVAANLDRLFGHPPIDVMNALAKTAYGFGLDPAKITYALGKISGSAEQMVAVINNAPMLRQKLMELEGKVKFKPRKNISHEPEKTFSSSTELNADKGAINDARQKWQESGTLEDYQSYKKLKDKLTPK